MYRTIDRFEFRDAFRQADTKERFTLEGLNALYTYFTDLEAETELEIEFDIIAFCCDYSEYLDIEEVKKDYAYIDSINDLQDATKVIEFDGGIIINTNF